MTEQIIVKINSENDVKTICHEILSGKYGSDYDNLTRIYTEILDWLEGSNLMDKYENDHLLAQIDGYLTSLLGEKFMKLGMKGREEPIMSLSDRQKNEIIDFFIHIYNDIVLESGKIEGFTLNIKNIHNLLNRSIPNGLERYNGGLIKIKS